MKTAILLCAAAIVGGCRTRESREPPPPSGPPATEAEPPNPSPPEPEADAPPVPPPGMVFFRGGDIDLESYYHHWRVPDFFLDTHETTVAEYRQCVEAGGCNPADTFVTRRGGLRCTGDGEQGLDVPITCVGLPRAEDYCRWRGKRLQYFAEWIWATHGPENRTFPWGEEPPDCTRLNAGSEPRGCGHGGLWPVGSAPAGASPEGIFDLEGNVAEMTARHRPDDWSRAWQLSGSVDGGANAGSSFYLSAEKLSQLRKWETGSGDWTDHGSPTLGIRCALEVHRGELPFRLKELPEQDDVSPMVRHTGGELDHTAPPRGRWNIPDFDYDIREATVAEYRRCRQDFEDTKKIGCWAEPAKASKDNPACTWGRPDADALPINCITHRQAARFCEWAGKRLPTLEEWSWASSNHDGTARFPWGNEPVDCTRSNMGSDPPGCGHDGPWPPGTGVAGANWLGQVDLIGNLMEWVGSSTQEERKPLEPYTRGVAYLGGNSWRGDRADADTGALIVSSPWDTVSDQVGVRCAKNGPAGHGPMPINERTDQMPDQHRGGIR